MGSDAEPERTHMIGVIVTGFSERVRYSNFIVIRFITLTLVSRVASVFLIPKFSVYKDKIDLVYSPAAN